MAQHDDVTYGDELLIFNKKVGFLAAWAEETKESMTGIATLTVAINSKEFPGVHEMKINTNEFEVWKIENPDAAKALVKAYLPRWLER